MQNQPFIPATPQQPMVKPDNCLVWSILVTLFCCLPFGIVAIVKSSSVDSLWFSGQYAAAVKAAKEAQTWCIVSLCVGAGFSFLYFFFLMLCAVAA